jgi:hypothetical protein
VKMPDGMANTNEQVMAKGFTVYYWVDSIEEVSNINKGRLYCD